MTTRAWILLGAAAVLWGIPYLLIKVAVEELAPVVVVFARTAIAAAVLAPLALRSGAVARLRTRLGALTAVALVEVTLPFMLITTGERYISSALAGLLVAATPLVAALLALRLGDESFDPSRVFGLVVGVCGVGVLMGLDLGGEAAELAGAAMMLGAACCYAGGAVMIGRFFAGIPPLGVVTAMLAITSLLLAPAALLSLPDSAPSPDAIGAVVALALASTAAGFLVFFALIDAAGASRATVVTYLNPAVALALGVLLLEEPFTAATAAGFAFILTGSVLATAGTPWARIRASRWSRSTRRARRGG